MTKESQLSEIFTEAKIETESQPSTEEDAFNEIFAQSVYEGLSWISNLVAPVLHVYLRDAVNPEIGFGKNKLDVQDAEILEKNLERMFGFGARVVEYKILQTLCAKLRLDEEIRADFKFSDEVKRVKKHYGTKPRSRKKSTVKK